LVIKYGFHDCPFGKALVMLTDYGICGLAFADPGQEPATLADMCRRWPDASYVDDPVSTGPVVSRIFERSLWKAEQPLRIVFIGSDFETRVWQTLLRIPMGQATTYSDIASHIGNSKASRAVGAAVGKNPISFVVPCHRVLGKSGSLCGYHWGLTRKQAILGWEAGFLSGESEAA
jgi:AraC family transcriptional regulator of adaptative response/methylated-DNA-[protein]-cysteine methyltransferase